MCLWGRSWWCVVELLRCVGMCGCVWVGVFCAGWWGGMRCFVIYRVLCVAIRCCVALCVNYTAVWYYTVLCELYGAVCGYTVLCDAG